MAPTPTAHQVEIFFSIPDELVTAGFTGEVPITFGVPFPEGALDSDAYLDVFQQFPSEACTRPRQFDVTAYWTPDAPNPSVKWLLVDALVSIDAGQIAPVFLQFDNQLPPPTAGTFPWNTGFAARIAQAGTTPTAPLSVHDVGSFELVTDGTIGSGLESYISEANASVVETNGPVRTVLKVTGNYLRTDPTLGAQRLAQYTTRYTLYRDQPYMRVYHTMIWGRDGAPADEHGFDYRTPIERLAYHIPGVSASTGCTQVDVGTSLGLITTPCTPRNWRQRNEIDLEDSGSNPSVYAADLNGWLSVNNTSPHDDVFVGLRWAKEQFPSGFDVSGTQSVAVRLLDARGASWGALSENLFTAGTWSNTPADNPQPNHPAGVAKSYELWVWPHAASLSSQIGNAFVQGGVMAYADPHHVVQANVPSRMSACHACVHSVSPATRAIETAISNTFTYLERTREPGTPDRGYSRLGAFHFGDNFYKTPSSLTTNRYWLNQGAGFSSLPWMLWMRSGERRYRTYGEAAIRHLMDVDGVHIDRDVIATTVDGTEVARRKNRGLQGQYNHQHVGFAAQNPSDNNIVGKTGESDGLALAYHLTGDERAREALEIRAAAISDRWTPGGQIRTLLENILAASANPTYGYSASNPGPTGNGPVSQYAILGELSVLYGSLGPQYPQLKTAALEYIDAILALQNSNDGYFMGSFRGHWLDYSLMTAAQVFPSRRDAIHSALARWDEYHGSIEAPGPSGKMGGPSTLQSALVRYRATGDERVRQQAQAVAYTQALSVHSDASATGAGASWIGHGGIPRTYLGPAVRDWLAVLALEREGIPMQANLLPLPYIDHALDRNVTDWVQRFFTVKDKDEDLVLRLDFGHMNTGYLRRAIDMEVTDPNGVTLSAASGCIERRENQAASSPPVNMLHTHVPLPSECSTTTPFPFESFDHVITPAQADLAGVYQVDVTIPQAGAQHPAAAMVAYRVKERTNQALHFDGVTGHYVQRHTSRVYAQNKMSVAFRMATQNTNVQTVFTQPYQYQAYTVGGRLYVRYYLTNGVTTVTPLHSVLLPATPAPLESVVSSLHVDEASGDVRVTICTEDNILTGCEASTYHYPGFSVLLNTHPFTIGRNGMTDNGYFSGDIDDIRIFHRVLSSHEIQAYFDGDAHWTVGAQDFVSGEAFLFDGDLSGLIDADATVSHGVEGVDYTFQTLATPTRVARETKVVQYVPGLDDPTCCSPSLAISNSDCYARGPAPNYVGVVHGRFRGGDLKACQIPHYGVQQFGFIDGQGAMTAADHEITVDGLPSSMCTASLPTPPTLDNPEALLVKMNSSAPRFTTGGLQPLYARTPDRWFDAQSCVHHSRVGRFFDDQSPPNYGHVSFPHLELGNAYTVSFKMRVSSASAVEYVMNQLYELRVYTLGGNVYVQHYGLAGGSAVVSAPYPIDEWVQVTSTAEFVGGEIISRLYFNGRLVDEMTVTATGFNRPSPGFAFLLGKQRTTDATSFTGLLDDVWIESGTAGPEAQDWYRCEESHPGALVSETFESCPSGATGFIVLDRQSEAIVTDCSPAGPVCP